ncbi:MAG: 1-deoxy-D-xylulose-5-phosphate reductoisomerase [Lachnospiraceae bacterium]|nr:1-deoxy-D-xylulose-5-phosphate reductoisomerase [Candidatus Minthocola equi]
MKKLAILGSTGSIGTQTLDVVRTHGDIEITALAAGTNVALAEKQAREFSPKLVCMYDEAAAAQLQKRLSDTGIKVLTGMDGLNEVASASGADIVLTAVVGMIGIRPTLAAIEAGADIALANKETLVTAGHLVTEAAARKGVKLLPVDSEHSAIYQCLAGEKGNKIEKILLTCSGGPFRGLTMQEMADKTPADALAHPNWNMGRKITIDSATLVNKGLEIMEARWLFDVSIDDIQVVVQPGSIIHSMVQFTDGAVMAQLGTPDMKIPIQYALYYPKRRELNTERLDFTKLTSIQVERPDEENFPALALARTAGRTGGTLPTIFNAANEWAVAEFLAGRIGFLDIVRNIEKAMQHIDVVQDATLEDILKAQEETIKFLARGNQ